jgi:plasmid stabilization system protein ParE
MAHLLKTARRNLPFRRTKSKHYYSPYVRPRSLGDLAEIIGHIAEDDSEAASRFGNSLLDHIELLARFPPMGGTIRKRSRVRKLLHSPILVYYQIREDKHLIEILHLRHAARQSPKL